MTRLVIPGVFVFTPLSLTRVSDVDDNFINKPRLVQDGTIRRTKTCKHCCGDRKKWYGGYHGQSKKWSGARRTCRTGDDGLELLQSCQDGATTSLVLTTNQESQCVLFNDQIRCRQWGSNPGALDSEPDALPLRHRAPLASTGTECRRKNNIYKAIFFLHFSLNSSYKSSFYLEKTLDPFIRLMKVLNKSL